MQESMKDASLEIGGHTLSTHRSTSPCLYLDRLRDCTVLSRIKPSEIHEITSSDSATTSTNVAMEGQDSEFKREASSHVREGSSSTASSSSSASSSERKWYNVVGSARLRGFVPRRWRAAATVVAYFEGGAGPGLYSLQLLTCSSGMTPFYTGPSSSSSPSATRTKKDNLTTDSTASSAANYSSSFSQSSQASSPQELIIGEFEVISVRGFFVNPIQVEQVRDGLQNISTSYASSQSPSAPTSPSESTPPSTLTHPTLQSAQPTYFTASQSSPNGNPLFHHSSYTSAPTTNAVIAHAVMAGLWFAALLVSWIAVHWRLGRRLPFLHPLLALPSVYIYLRLLAFAFCISNLYEAVIQHQVHTYGYVSLGLLRRPACASTLNEAVPNAAYDASSSWRTSTTSFQTMGVRSPATPSSVPTASQVLRAQLSCSAIYNDGGSLNQGAVGSSVPWPLIQYFAIKILPAFFWSSCAALLALTIFYISRGGSLTRPWGIDRKTKLRTIAFVVLIAVTSFATILTFSIATNATKVPNDMPTPSATGGSWYLRNSASTSDAKRETLATYFESTLTSSLASLIPTSFASYVPTSILPVSMQISKSDWFAALLINNSLFWRLSCYVIIIMAAKSCLSSCTLILESLQKQMTVLERELHATSANARDLWNLARTHVAAPIPTRPVVSRSSPLVGRSSALSQILDPATSSLAAETAVTPRERAEEDAEDQEAVRRRERRQLREERKRSPVVLISKLVRSVRRKQSAFKVIHLNVAVTFALTAFLALVSPSWSLQKAKILNAVLLNLLYLLFFAVLFYIFIPDKAKFKSLFQHNKYLRRQDRRKRKEQAELRSRNGRNGLSDVGSPFLSDAEEMEDLEMDGVTTSAVRPLIPWNGASDDNDDSRELILEVRDAKGSAPSSKSKGNKTTKNGADSPLDDTPDRQFSSDLLHKASLLADKDGFLSEDAKKSLWGETVRSNAPSLGGSSKSRGKLPLARGRPATPPATMDLDDDDGTESVSSSTSLLPPSSRAERGIRLDLSSTSIPSTSTNYDEEEGFNNNPFSLVIIYPPSVKVTVPPPKPLSSIASTPVAPIIDLSSSVGADGDDAPFVLPFAPVPLHPRLAARLKRSSPLPPSMMAALASPTPPVSPPSSTSAAAAPPTIKPPSVALARMAHPTSHSETVIVTPRA